MSEEPIEYVTSFSVTEELSKKVPGYGEISKKSIKKEFAQFAKFYKEKNLKLAFLSLDKILKENPNFRKKSIFLMLLRQYYLKDWGNSKFLFFKKNSKYFNGCK